MYYSVSNKWCYFYFHKISLLELYMHKQAYKYIQSFWKFGVVNFFFIKEDYRCPFTVFDIKYSKNSTIVKYYYNLK